MHYQPIHCVVDASIVIRLRALLNPRAEEAVGELHLQQGAGGEQVPLRAVIYPPVTPLKP